MDGDSQRKETVGLCLIQYVLALNTQSLSLGWLEALIVAV